MEQQDVVRQLVEQPHVVEQLVVVVEQPGVVRQLVEQPHVVE